MWSLFSDPIALLSNAGTLLTLWLLLRAAIGIYRNWIRPRYNLISRYGGGWACVTGGTDGLGLAYCELLADLGFNIVIISRNPTKLAQVADELRGRKGGVQVRTVEADFSKFNENGDAAGWFERIDAQLCDLDISLFISNAAMSTKGKLVVQKPIQIKKEIEVNATPNAALLSLVIPRMLERGSRGGIINVSSFAANFALPMHAVYAGSKRFN